MRKSKKIIMAAGLLGGAAFVWHLRKKAQKVEKLERKNEELQEENDCLEEFARTDELTRLNNRYALREDFDTFCDNHVMVIVLDVDSFKKFNDTYGHQMGDLVLETVGEGIKEIFYGCNCYRIGGDEFLIISEMIAPAVLEMQMNQLQIDIGIALMDELDETVEISYGYSFGNIEQKEDLRKLFRLADQNLYEAKERTASGKEDF